VIPRSEDDGLELWPQGKYEGEEEIEDVLKMIKEGYIYEILVTGGAGFTRPPRLRARVAGGSVKN